MKHNIMHKNLRQSILKSLGRYLAIVSIIAIGAGIFVGLRASKRDMLATGQQFMDEQNMFDLRLLSSYGWDDESVEQIRALDGVTDAEGVVMLDAIVKKEGSGDSEMVYRFYNMPETVNKIALRGGRMPEKPNECLAQGYQNDDSILGTTVTVAGINAEETLDALVYDTYTIVGYVATPLYMDMNRGTTTIGNGNVASFLYIPDGGIDAPYYSEIDITVPATGTIYSDEYNDSVASYSDVLEPEIQKISQDRFDRIRREATDALEDGRKEYNDGMKQLEDGKAESRQQLDDAKKQLDDAQHEIDSNAQMIEDGHAQIQSAQQMLESSRQELENAGAELSGQKAKAYAQLDSTRRDLEEKQAQVTDGLQRVTDGLAQIAPGLSQLNDGMAQLQDAQNQIAGGLQKMDGAMGLLDADIRANQAALEIAKNNPLTAPETIAALEEKIAASQGKYDGLAAQKEELLASQAQCAAKLEELQAKKLEIENTQLELEATRTQLEDAKAQLAAGFTQLEQARAAADQQFAAAEQKLADGRGQLESGMAELENQKQNLYSGQQALEDGKAQLEDGRKEYEDGKKEADRTIRENEQKLADAKLELEDAQNQLDDMKAPEAYILDRTTNLGYNSLYSNADIVAGVSRVFPVFFLLIAALVCITTMTRMVNEERTQIGTLKALGYSNGAIISKYLMYAGSGAILGCGLGVVLGSVIFPIVLWKAYCIMLYINPHIRILFNWPLCIAVVLVYTAVMMLVTWACCRNELREVPAELIRPKAPASGKKLILEKFPLWRRLSFLNKVAIRNIFRYHQRLAMMLLGIGGCTALLVTGFGLRDSIVNIVDYQYQDITAYDMEVYFAEHQTPEDQQRFTAHLGDDSDQVFFFHQESADAINGKKNREVRLIAGEDTLEQFMKLHDEETPVTMPGQDEVILSVGTADALGIHEGETLTLRTADMQEMELTVSGIFDNYIYNYAIVTPETMEAHFDEAPEQQMAYVKVSDTQDVHEVGAAVAAFADVMNVSVNKDVADMVGSMMKALDLVVITVVICAGLLAITVLYNLTNININERIREIATIKVLGFNARETAAYVFKENLALSVMGVVVGLPAGMFLLKFVIAQIKIDLVWFQARVAPVSYLFSFILTILSAFVVMCIFYYKLEKIDMAEALKSVE